MFQTIVRHNGLPRNIAVLTNSEIIPRISLSEANVGPFKTKLRPSKVVLTPASASKPSLYYYTCNMCFLLTENGERKRMKCSLFQTINQKVIW